MIVASRSQFHHNAYSAGSEKSLNDLATRRDVGQNCECESLTYLPAAVTIILVELPMARRESDRDDLLAEATAFVRRVEFRIPEEPEPVVIGIHADGRFSVYFGSDPVFHLSATGRLRRAFVAGELYRTQGETLARLRRERSETETVLKRYDLNGEELARFLQTARVRLHQLATACENGCDELLRRVPPEWEYRDELIDRLSRILPVDSPLAERFPGKR